jgi:hypothetical protein
MDAAIIQPSVPTLHDFLVEAQLVKPDLPLSSIRKISSRRAGLHHGGFHRFGGSLSIIDTDQVSKSWVTNCIVSK